MSPETPAECLPPPLGSFVQVRVATGHWKGERGVRTCRVERQQRRKNEHVDGRRETERSRPEVEGRRGERSAGTAAGGSTSPICVRRSHFLRALAPVNMRRKVEGKQASLLTTLLAGRGGESWMRGGGDCSAGGGDCSTGERVGVKECRRLIGRAGVDDIVEQSVMLCN